MFIARWKGGLRRADVSDSVCSFFDFPLNFTMVMGSFTQKHVLIQTDQSESRDCVWAHSDWPIRKKVMLTNPNFLIISPCKGIKGELYLWYVSLSVVSVNRGWIESRVKGQWLQLWRVSGQWLHLWLQLQRVSGHTCGYNLFSAGLSTSVLVILWRIYVGLGCDIFIEKSCWAGAKTQTLLNIQPLTCHDSQQQILPAHIQFCSW